MKPNSEMGSTMRLLLVVLVTIFIGGGMGATPRKPIDVPFGRNYVPTWAFDHIKYFNGGNEIQLHLDKSTGMHLFLLKH